MKKLALALVCLVSVAFFASCTDPVENPEPSIQICTEAGYAQDGDVVDLGSDVVFGFVMSSNAETKKQLATLVVTIDDVQWANIALTETNYTYTDTIVYAPERDAIIGRSVINAVVTDIAGKTATATINLSINEPEEPLEVKDFEWYRLGNTTTGLEEYGLYWERNIKDPHAQIKPLENVTLYKFESTVWDEVNTETQKAAKFNDGAVTTSVYNNVDLHDAASTYDDVIGTRMPDGTLHLIHVTSCRVGAYQSAGTPTWIYGQSK